VKFDAELYYKFLTYYIQTIFSKSGYGNPVGVIITFPDSGSQNHINSHFPVSSVRRPIVGST
jgi:hypothetical protein